MKWLEWLGIGRKKDTPRTDYTEGQEAKRKVLVNRLSEIVTEMRELRERHDAESAKIEADWARRDAERARGETQHDKD